MSMKLRSRTLRSLPGEGPTVLANLNAALWSERQLLETLLYRLTMEKLVLLTGNTRWLALASDEVQAVIEELRETEMLRAAVVDGVALEYGLAAGPTLAELKAVVPEPWQLVLDDHLDEFRRLAAEVQQISTENRDLLVGAARSTREALLAMQMSDEGYGRDGQSRGSLIHTAFFDRAL